MNIAATVQALINLVSTSGLDLSTPTAKVDTPLVASIDFQTGAGANQINSWWGDTRTLANNASENLDLNAASGGLSDAFGVGLQLARVKLLYVRNKNSTQTLTVGGAASNGFTTLFGATDDTIKIAPGGFLLLVAPDATGYAVTAATGDLLKIANGNGGTSTDYDIIVAGSLT